MKHPDTMSTEAAIVEISALRDEIRTRSARLNELAISVYRKARRAPADDTTAIYLAYANSITRFAGMVDQGAVRTDRAARILDMLPVKEEELPKKEEKEPVVTASPSLSPMESLISSYIEEGEEVEIPQNDGES